MTSSKAFRYGALFGIATSAILFINYALFDHIFGGFELLVWPAAVLLGAANGWTAFTAALFLASIMGNAVLYGVVALVLSLIWTTAKKGSR